MLVDNVCTIQALLNFCNQATALLEEGARISALSLCLCTIMPHNGKSSFEGHLG